MWIFNFDKATRPFWRTDEHVLGRVIIDLKTVRYDDGPRDITNIGFEYDSCQKDGQTRTRAYVYQYDAVPPGQRHPMVDLPSQAGETFTALLARAWWAVEQGTAGNQIMVAPITVNLPTPPPARQHVKPDLNPGPWQDRKKDGAWPVLIMPQSADLAKEVYLHGLVVARVILDCRAPDLIVTLHKMVGCGWGPDDKYFPNSADNFSCGDDGLYDVLTHICTGQTIEVELKAAVTPVLADRFGAVLVEGFPPNERILHAERLNSDERHRPDFPPAETPQTVVIDGYRVRQASDGKSWMKGADNPDRGPIGPRR